MGIGATCGDVVGGLVVDHAVLPFLLLESVLRGCMVHPSATMAQGPTRSWAAEDSRRAIRGRSGKTGQTCPGSQRIGRERTGLGVDRPIAVHDVGRHRAAWTSPTL